MKVQLHPPAKVQSQADVRLLLNEAKGFVKAADDCEQKRLEYYWEAGLRLRKIKQVLGHGKFGSWLRENFDGSERLAERWMELSNTTRASDLREEWRRICGRRPRNKVKSKDPSGTDSEPPPTSTLSGIPDRLKPIFEDAPLFDKDVRRANSLANIFAPAVRRGLRCADLVVPQRE
jgi:Protein of unknown function (DUF3102)